ncbi:hypothetical protein PC117_g9351 [Phytophthora cactorum]|uniref:RanBP2-type domain-containing protein n=2 Tax=Phytophthora cactorum TaxID=29920 RepID=A0A8T1DV65_9STRA|nr:hypothetical protein PC117_g9351 [Phytophthora cactorum]
MRTPSRLLLPLVVVAAQVHGAEAANGSLPTWLAYVTGGLLVIIIVYYCCRRARFDENLQQPLLGGQYTEDGQPMTRQDVQESNDEVSTQWQCEVCDFHNKSSSKSCVLCGTERGFSLGLNSPVRPAGTGPVAVETDVPREKSFNRTRSFAIRRLNMLNTRQRGARNRQDWVRKVGIDGKRYWAKRELPFPLGNAKPKDNGDDSNDKIRIDIPASDADMLSPKGAGSVTGASSASTASTTDPDKELVHQQSLAFVSQLAQTPRHPEGRMTFKEYREVDARVASRGYEISEQDLEILEQVAALPFKDKYAWFLEQTSALIKPWEDGHLKMRVHRENILVESMEQLLGVQMEHIHMPLRIEFIVTGFTDE